MSASTRSSNLNLIRHPAAEPIRPAAPADDTIQRIMELAERPDVISFAGGFPAPSVQRWQELRDLTIRTLIKRNVAQAFGYGPTSGLTRLRELLAQHMQAHGRPTAADEVLVTAGGVAGLDLVAATLTRPGDLVATGHPTYVGALQVFASHGLRVEAVPVGDAGWDLDLLNRRLAAAAAGGRPIRLLYVVPSFDNPTGVTLDLERRRTLLRLAAAHDCWVVEDGAYEELYFESPPPPTLASLDRERVIHVNTFSKTLCPGFRLGWITGPAAVLSKLARRKQAWDQCSSTFGQHVAITALESPYLRNQLRRAREQYRCRRDRLLDALAGHLEGVAGWNVPGGGFFLWLRLAAGIDAETVARTAWLENKVAVVPGTPFYASAPDPGTIRLAYSSVDEARIEEGVRALREAIDRAAGVTRHTHAL